MDLAPNRTNFLKLSSHYNAIIGATKRALEVLGPFFSILPNSRFRAPTFGVGNALWEIPDPPLAVFSLLTLTGTGPGFSVGESADRLGGASM